jgi:hypothetical protein
MGGFRLEELGSEVALLNLAFTALAVLSGLLDGSAAGPRSIPSLQVHMRREKSLVVCRAAEGLPPLGLFRLVEVVAMRGIRTGSKVGL